MAKNRLYQRDLFNADCDATPLDLESLRADLFQALVSRHCLRTTREMGRTR